MDETGVHKAAHEQVLHQGLHILGGIWGGRVVGRQLDQRGQEVLTFLHVFLHFLLVTKELTTLVSYRLASCHSELVTGNVTPPGTPR